jgi:NADH-quinone oxidoreductase subunit L
VALGGLFLGFLVYKDVKAGDADPLEKPLGFLYPFLKNKWYFDEFYAFFVIKPITWFSEVFVYQWMDRRVIDGILHFFARAALFIGHVFRNYFDKPVINEFIGDKLGAYWTFQPAGRALSKTQTGRIQTYLIGAVAVLVAIGAALYLFAF